MAIVSRIIKSAVTRILASVGLKLSRIERDPEHDSNDVATFIPLSSEYMEAARAAGLSVGDYVDTVLNKVPGSSQSTIDKMASVGIFAAPLETIVEIGPGTGRYLEKTIKVARPARYEIYETAGPWASYLVSEYNAALQPTDGYSLAGTSDASVDLVHVRTRYSSTVPFMVTSCYLQEMVRVVRPVDGRSSMSSPSGVWMPIPCRSGPNPEFAAWFYPAVFPRSVVENFFTSNGFEMSGSFLVPMMPGTTELLVFRRSAAAMSPTVPPS